MDFLPQPLDCRHFVLYLHFLREEAFAVCAVADRFPAEIPVLPHFAEVAGTNPLNKSQV